MKFFSYDSKFSQIVLKLCSACYLNLLWFICSIPLFTAGAATTALYTVTFKIVREDNTHIARDFFRAFRRNFRQATVLWLILLGVGLLLCGDAYVLFHLYRSSEGGLGVLWTVFFAVIIAGLIVYAIVLAYTFPLLASFENTNRAMLKNAFLIGVHYLFATLMVLAVHFVMFFVVVAWFTPLIIFGEGLCALLSSLVLVKVMDAVAPSDEETEPTQ